MENKSLQTLNTSKLTKLERRWFKEYLDCFNATEALRKVRKNKEYSENGTNQLAFQLRRNCLRKLNIGPDDLMEMQGLTDEYLHNKLLEKTKSKSLVVIKDKVVEVDDNLSQIKATELVLKLRNRFPSNKVELTGRDGGPVQMDVLAGVAFVPNIKNVEITNTESNWDAPMAEGSTMVEPQEVQSTDLASASTQDNNSDK